MISIGNFEEVMGPNLDAIVSVKDDPLSRKDHTPFQAVIMLMFGRRVTARSKFIAHGIIGQEPDLPFFGAFEAQSRGLVAFNIPAVQVFHVILPVFSDGIRSGAIEPGSWS